MKIIVTGATGLVGAEVLREAIKDPAITGITAITRKAPPLQHEKIRTIIHSDFLDYSALREAFMSHDAVLWCLGISQTQVSKEEYHKITYEYTLKAAETIARIKPGLRFLFLSGMGADQSGKSRTLFGRVKGMTEKDLLASGLTDVYILRPGGIKPIHKNPNTALSNKIMIPFFPVLEFLMPSAVISSVELAKAMLSIAKNGSEQRLLDNVSLKSLAK